MRKANKVLDSTIFKLGVIQGYLIQSNLFPDTTEIIFSDYSRETKSGITAITQRISLFESFSEYENSLMCCDLLLTLSHNEKTISLSFYLNEVPLLRLNSNCIKLSKLVKTIFSDYQFVEGIS